MALEPTALPTAARTVVIGGGIVGCSTAYHLAKLGWTDTVLLEKHKLTSGSTFHAAGLVGQLRTSANITQLLGNSVELYKTLEAETGQATGWKMNGGLRLACNEERWTEVKRQATTAKSFGLEMHLLTPKEAQHLWPLMEIDDVEGAVRGKYARVTVETASGHTAWAYQCGEAALLVRRIEGGDWLLR